MNLATSDTGVKVTLQTVEDEPDYDLTGGEEEPRLPTEPTVLVHAHGEAGAIGTTDTPQESTTIEMKEEGVYGVLGGVLGGVLSVLSSHHF